ncbi:MAG: helix-turn-helix domain-containing protein [Gemmatimonadaceae bacterium]
MQFHLLDSATAGADVGRSPTRRLQLHRDAPSIAVDAGSARFWRPFPRKVLDVVCAEGSVTEVSFHAHEAVQVLLPTSPFVVIGGGGRATVLRPGVIHVTGPLEPRAARSLDGAPFGMRLLLVAPAALGVATAGLAARPHAATWPVPSRTQVPDAAARITELLVEDGLLYADLMAVFDSLRRPLVMAGCESRLLQCLTRLIACRANPAAVVPDAGTRVPAGVVRARDYLRARPMESVSLDELAAVAGLSKFYLLRAFSRAYGLTPHAYQMELRLARARRLLAEGRPLSHVTYDAGFADQSHLTRRFAAFYGLTPARYARQLATHPGGAVPHREAIGSFATPPSAA